ncbi:undecaprenyldiphospho-muramoylpentapeptide beta-N-acetylglucosaminyltransferase [Bartonella tamiae]|uniref:UDP-N-acetylglucosamine--N-acetylmuramyl-(pentapeptide) pyrophosphoryl-undecaprenol N-acetylglucosamine transferase n=1 Tax=Bartonella tamiae Th239 TaxID=1094558 RepID=J1JWU6_9HYPH|nr:undecaprenyldiphospho-muramoylpentapeptide beta-N-acetylglucosaminyltransferase [Bartonella tamiae Th239]EJF94685.1 undecaprenyldiphospho-muramoylpentapeptide beta-N-acetylglucosaminyltransferase [Bartonella tamiae Th307]
MSKKQTIFLVAGGTGGHLFPAEALGEELCQRGYDVHLATDMRAKQFVRFFDDDHIHIVPSATITGKNPIALIKTLWQLVRGVRYSRKLFRQFKPVLVGGFGGYPTLPPLYAAQSRGILTFIHEQNAVMGRANHALAAKANAIAGGFLAKEGPFAEKIYMTGNPLRSAVIEVAKQPYKPSRAQEPFHLLIFGGSQGASFFSQIVPQAMELVDKDILKRLRIVHQSRGDAPALKSAYKALGIEAEIAPFFDDMAQKMANAQFIIARSGASTVSEIAGIGRPALLVPYPYALDHDQAMNAARLAQTGGVKVIEEKNLDAQELADLLKVICHNSELLMTQAQAAHTVGVLDATKKLANLAEAIIKGEKIEACQKGETA